MGSTGTALDTGTPLIIPQFCPETRALIPKAGILQRAGVRDIRPHRGHNITRAAVFYKTI